MISVVMPAYNEAPVIEATLRRACAALRLSNNDFEIIVVDDASADGTADIAEAVGRELPVRVLRRPGRWGLATAVVDGWAMARGDLLGVIDADLQHPPEVLCRLANALQARDADVAIASRYMAGGGTSDNWPWLRRLISRASTRLGASILPWTFSETTDPGSGMFLVRAKILKGVELKPIGVRVLLEVLCKTHHRKLVEVPYVFERRGRGKSKLGTRQFLEYVLHLLRLARATGQSAYWIRYNLIGLSGAALELAGLLLLVKGAAWKLGLALPVAIQFALLSNFFWNHTVTFRATRPAERKVTKALARLLQYEKVCVPGAVLNMLVTFLLASQGVRLVLAAATGLLMGGVWNATLNVRTIWGIWGDRSAPNRRADAHEDVGKKE